MEMERRRERVAHAASGLRGRFVAECGRGGELLLDCVDVTVELHDDITMTSSMKSVKVTFDIAAPPRCKRRSRAKKC